MFNLIVISTILAVATAMPTVLHGNGIHVPVISTIAALPTVESIPATVSAVSTIPATISTIPATVAVPTTTTTITHHATPILTGYRTILQPETIKIHEPAIAKVGDLIQKIPTSVSHQSQTIVHKHADVITPIVAPAVKTSTHRLVKTITTPVLYAATAPVVKIIHE